ncbi:MAG: NAD(P)-binding domain-containing protein [Chloroflexi bacterium]|nr:NAD(P)-binding domain-containing protein [Chloroflexota bacterium]
MDNHLPVAVIGAGPVGLAAAAHLLERGETPILFEAGTEVGTNIRSWQHVRMFSPWEFTVDSASVRLLEKHGWHMPPQNELPTGYDLLEQYLTPLAELPEIKTQLRLNAKVVAISRRDIDKMQDAQREAAPFVLHIVYGDGQEALVEARAVIDASGTWHQPNPLGSGGLPVMGEKRYADHIAYGIPDILGEASARYANQRVMVVGSGHSAINALLELVELQADYPETRLVWAMRSTNLARVLGGGEDDALPARGKLGLRIKAALDNGSLSIVAPFRVRELNGVNGGIDVVGDTPDGFMTVQVDELIVSTGARPDLNMLRELRLELDPSLESTRALGPMIDPNIHSCGTVRPHGEAELRHPEKDFYIVGMKSYGRAPTFLLATGYEQVRSVVAALVGDWEAARDVQLNLPETGVCSTDLAGEGAACCGTPNNLVPQANTISLTSIPVVGHQLQLVSLPTASRACGCDDTCCGDGVRSTSCGCETSCCS